MVWLVVGSMDGGVGCEGLGNENLLVIPPAEAPPSFPIPQSPYSSATDSRIIFARKPWVRASEVGEWIASWGMCGFDVGVAGQVFGSG